RTEATTPHDYAVVGFFFGHTRGRSGMSEEKQYLSNGSDAAPKPSKALGWAADVGAKMVDLKFTDLLGTWQHVSLPLSALDESNFEEGLGFDGSSIRGW